MIQRLSARDGMTTIGHNATNLGDFVLYEDHRAAIQLREKTMNSQYEALEGHAKQMEQDKNTAELRLHQLQKVFTGYLNLRLVQRRELLELRLEIAKRDLKEFEG